MASSSLGIVGGNTVYPASPNAGPWAPRRSGPAPHLARRQQLPHGGVIHLRSTIPELCTHATRPRDRRREGKPWPRTPLHNQTLRGIYRTGCAMSRTRAAALHWVRRVPCRPAAACLTHPQGFPTVYPTPASPLVSAPRPLRHTRFLSGPSFCRAGSNSPGKPVQPSQRCR